MRRSKRRRNITSAAADVSPHEGHWSVIRSAPQSRQCVIAQLFCAWRHHLGKSLDQFLKTLPVLGSGHVYADAHSPSGLHAADKTVNLNRPAELWEFLQLVKSDRAMVRGEIYRYDG